MTDRTELRRLLDEASKGIAPYCTGCEASDEYAVVWPCPTIAAMGGEQ